MALDVATLPLILYRKPFFISNVFSTCNYSSAVPRDPNLLIGIRTTFLYLKEHGTLTKRKDIIN